MKIEALLSNLALRNERILQPIIEAWLSSARKQIVTDLKSRYEKSVVTRLTDWKVIEENGVKKIKPAILEIMQTGGNAAYKYLAIQGAFDVVNVRAIKAAEKLCAKLVREVTDNTKKAIRAFIKDGIERGYSMPEISRQLRPIVGLTKGQTQSVLNKRLSLIAQHPNWTTAQIDRAT